MKEVFSKRNKTVSFVLLDNNRKRYDVLNTRKTERKFSFASFSLKAGGTEP